MDLNESSGNRESTGREYPERPYASVAACVFKDNKVLLIKRAKPPSQGRWSVPGGMIELGETLEDAARRELEEEGGIEIKTGRIFNVENLIVPDGDGKVLFHYVVTYLTAYYRSGTIRPGSDELDICWAARDELPQFDMSPVVRKNMTAAFNYR